MHIVMVIHSLQGGGAERVTVLLANAWLERGNCVSVVTLGTDDSIYPLTKGVRLVRLGLAAKSAGTMAAVIGNYRRVRALRRIFKEEKPDAIIGMMNSASILVAIASIGLSVRTIGAERIYPPLQPLSLIWKLLRRLLYGRLDVVVGQTEAASRWLKVHTLAREVHTIPNPVIAPLPLGTPILSPDDVVNPTRNVLLAMGRLEPQKGFIELIGVFSDIARQNSDWDLVILGEGESRLELENEIKVNRLPTRIFLPGRVGNVADWFARSQLFVLSSQYEGFPNVLTEAMAAGLPVVAYDCLAGPADIIRHEVDGLLVPLGDKKALASALDRMMSSPKLRSAMANCALEITARFSLQQVLILWNRALNR